MKWGRKKASSTSSHSSLITHVFPVSWLSKFKQKKDTSEPKLAKAKQGVQLDLPSPSSSSLVRWKEGRFYSGDDDPYWRLSFGEESEKPTVGLNSVSQDSYDDDLGAPVTDSKVLESEEVEMDGREVAWKFNDMVSELRKTRNFQENTGVPLENDAFRGKKLSEDAEVKKTRTKAVKHHKFRNRGKKTLEENKAERGPNKEDETTSKSADKVIFEVQPETIVHAGEDFWESRASNSRKRRSFSSPNSSLRTIEEDCILEALNLEETVAVFKKEDDEDLGLQWKQLKDLKIRETKSNSEQQRRSVYINRDCQRRRRKPTSRMKSYSPRTAAKIEFKIKALEDMKKTKTMKKKIKERAVLETTVFDNYAVIKSSYDPQQDFRDSMIEMIVEKGIERPEELEELLACYLTLNYDEYHDLIVKVFRQVWSELNELYLLQNYS